MGGFRCLSDVSYERIKELHRKKIISDKCYQELEDCNSLKELISIFKEELVINREKLILHIWDIVWQWKKCKKEINTVFNECQSQIIKELINQGNCSLKETFEKDLTEQQINNHIERLIEIELIMPIKTSKVCSRRIMYIINPKEIKKLR